MSTRSYTISVEWQGLIYPTSRQVIPMSRITTAVDRIPYISTRPIFPRLLLPIEVTGFSCAAAKPQTLTTLP